MEDGIVDSRIEEEPIPVDQSALVCQPGFQ
jgi:hypothetical protein